MLGDGSTKQFQQHLVGIEKWGLSAFCSENSRTPRSLLLAEIRGAVEGPLILLGLDVALQMGAFRSQFQPCLGHSQAWRLKLLRLTTNSSL